MPKRWLFRSSRDQQQVTALSATLGTNPVIPSLLVQRGIKTFEQAKGYFRPSLDDLPDPFRMQDMDKAVCRLIQAMETHESILIYGDYDVDGTTGVALLYGFLKTIYPSIDFYIPCLLYTSPSPRDA